jgi:hypothetical protein
MDKGDIYTMCLGHILRNNLFTTLLLSYLPALCHFSVAPSQPRGDAQDC